MSNFILEHLESRIRDDSKIIYYFCNIKNNKASRNARSVLQALIIQLCESRQRLFRLLPEDWAKDQKQFREASIDRLKKEFTKLLHHDAYARVYCVIDGLDVYYKGVGNDDDRCEEMKELIDILIKAFSSGTTSERAIKLLCTSRPDPDILTAWGAEPTKRLRGDPKDIEKFVHSRVASLTLNKRFRDAAIEKLFSKPQKTFLWVDVVIRKIEKIRLPNRNTIEEAIEGSSERLDKLYSDLIRDGVRNERQIARLLCWVIYAKRPLRCDELDDAIAIDPKDGPLTYERLRDAKPGLTGEMVHRILGTLLDVVGDEVYVIHQSVADFVERNPQLFANALDGISPRLLRAYTCMAYLQLDNLNDLDFDNSDDEDPAYLSYLEITETPFFQYAAEHWYLHIDSVTDIGGQLRLQKLLRGLIDPSFCTATLWLHHRMGPRTQKAWETAIELDLGWLAETLLNNTLEGLPDCFGKDCLLRAADQSGSVLKVLLESGNGHEFELSEDFLRKVAKYHSRSMMELVLEKRGADVQITQEVVMAAARSMHEPEDVMKLLLEERRADVQITEEVVIAAVENWCQPEGITRLLVKELGTNFQISEYLLIAVASNFAGEGVMRFLRAEHEAKVEITEKVVIAAASSWHTGEGAMSLLEELLIGNGTIQELVIAAAQETWGGEQLMGLLFDNYRDQVEITQEVAIAAARNWTAKGVRRLLEECGETFEMTEQVLIAAAQNSNNGEQVLRLFCEKNKAEVKAKVKANWSTLIGATDEIEVLRVLVDLYYGK